MERKLTQWWSSSPPISTKRTITSHLNCTYRAYINTKTYDVEKDYRRTKSNKYNDIIIRYTDKLCFLLGALQF